VDTVSEEVMKIQLSSGIGVAGNVASILSFLGLTAATVLAYWAKGGPIFVAVFGLAAGFWAGRMYESRHARKARSSPQATGPAPPVERRTLLVETARAHAVELTSQPWQEFPKWCWSLRLSQKCLRQTMERVEERVHIRMVEADVEKLVEDSVRMYIRECIAAWEAAARSREQSAAIARLRRQNFVTRWRHW
jgi:hypothetical protein